MKLKSTTQRLRSRALFTIVGGVVVINPAFAQQPATSPVASQTKSETLEEVVVTGLRGSLDKLDGHQARRARRGRRDQRRGHRQVPRHQSGRVVAANHRHLDRAPQRRRRAGHRARLRPAVQPGDVERPPDSRRRRLRQRRPAMSAARTRARARSISRSSGLRCDQRRRRSTRRPGRSCLRGGIGATIDIKTDRPFDHTGWSMLNVGAKGVYDDVQALRAATSLPRCPASSATPMMTRPGASALSASYQKRHGGSVQSTENAWNMQAGTAPVRAMRPDGTVTNAPADRPALRHAERYALCVLGLRARTNQRPGSRAVRADGQR